MSSLGFGLMAITVLLLGAVRTLSVSLVFLGIAVIFLATVLRSYLKDENKLTPARQTWLRLAFIFAAIAIALHVIQQLY